MSQKYRLEGILEYKKIIKEIHDIQCLSLSQYYLNDISRKQEYNIIPVCN